MKSQRDIDAGANLTGVDGSSQATSLAGAVPDPTVERPGVEVGS